MDMQSCKLADCQTLEETLNTGSFYIKLETAMYIHRITCVKRWRTPVQIAFAFTAVAASTAPASHLIRL